MRCFKNLHKHPLSCGWRTRKISKSKSCTYFLIQSKSICLVKVFQKVLISLESHGTGCWVSCGRRVRCRRKEGRVLVSFLVTCLMSSSKGLILWFFCFPVGITQLSPPPPESLLRSWGTRKERVGAGLRHWGNLIQQGPNCLASAMWVNYQFISQKILNVDRIFLSIRTEKCYSLPGISFL